MLWHVKVMLLWVHLMYAKFAFVFWIFSIESSEKITVIFSLRIFTMVDDLSLIEL